MKKQHPLFALLALAITIFAIFVLVYRYQNSVTRISSQINETTIQIEVSPAIMIFPQEFHLNWDVQGINAIYLNNNGVTGTETRNLAAYCQSVDFELVLRDSSYQRFTLAPFIWLDPMNISLIMVALYSLFISISSRTRQTLTNRLISLGNFREPNYWKLHNRFWLNIVLLFILVVTLPTLIFPRCLNNPDYTNLSSYTVAFTSIVACLALVINLVKASYLQKIAGFIAQYIPYTLTLMAVFVYWALSYKSIVSSDAGHLTIVHFQLALAVYGFGFAILLTTRNKETEVKSFTLPVSSAKRYLMTFFALVVWGFLYYSNWISFFENYFLQTLFGMSLFMLPGLLLAVAIMPVPTIWTRFITVGFVLSIFVAILSSVVAIAFGLTATEFQMFFIVAGAIAPMYLLLFRKSINLTFLSRVRFSLYDIFFLSLALLSVIILMLLTENPDPRGDFPTYNAMITEFAQTPQFSLRESFLGTGNVMTTRLWLIAWPVSQALIVNFSHLNILQMMSSISVLLASLVAVATYDVIRGFQIPREFACIGLVFTAFAILTQFDTDQIGWIFSHRLLHDKTLVAWILTPTLLSAGYDWLRYRTRGRAFIFFVIAITVVNCHATSYFYAALLCGIVACLYIVFQSQKWQDLVFVAFILGICAILPLILRELSPEFYVFEGGEVTRLPDYHRVRLMMTSDMRILGIAEFLRTGVAFTLIYISGFIGLFNIRKRPEAYYAIAGSIIILLVSNPITASVIARFVTPYHLWRATWFAPFGFSAAFLLWRLYGFVAIRNALFAKVVVAGIGILLMLTTASLATIRSAVQYRMLEDLLEVSESIPSNILDEQMTILASDDLNYWIPSLRWDLHSILWRETYLQAGISDEEHAIRLADYRRFFAEDLSIEEMDALIDKYRIRYIILNDNSHTHLLSLIDSASGIVNIHSDGVFRLWRVEN